MISSVDKFFGRQYRNQIKYDSMLRVTMSVTMSVRLTFLMLLLTNDHSKFLVSGIQKIDLYPYGRSNGDTRLSAKRPGAQNEDISSEEIKLKTNIKFFSNEYGAIYVRTLIIFIC